MGHANYTNLCQMFVKLLYAKGVVTIGDAVATADRRKERLHASEGEYDGESGMVGLALEEYCSFISISEFAYARRYWGWQGRWDGPFIVADLTLEVAKPKGFVPDSDYRALVAGMGMLDETRHGVLADFVQERGWDRWSDHIRILPSLRQHYEAWRDMEIDTSSEQWELTDKIPWRFVRRWRNRYREVPILSNVTH